MKLSAIALAIPLAVFGFACRTSSTQGSSGRTASTSGEYGGGQAQAGAEAGSSGATASGGVSTPSPDRQGASGDQQTASSDVRAHTDDKVVTGKLSQVSSDSVTITSDTGDTTTLQLVPQTTVRVDGRDAQTGDLQEGQPVRASFSEAEGQSVAVEIRAGLGALQGQGTLDPGTYVTDPNAPSVPGAGGHTEGGAGGTGGGPSDSTPPIKRP